MKITYGSNKKILKYINFRSFTAVEDGLNETIKWFNKFKNKNLFIKIK